MDYDLIRSLEDAWGKVEPTLRSDPDALASRLARRRKPLIFGRRAPGASPSRPLTSPSS